MKIININKSTPILKKKGKIRDIIITKEKRKGKGRGTEISHTDTSSTLLIRPEKKKISRFFNKVVRNIIRHDKLDVRSFTENTHFSVDVGYTDPYMK